MIPLTEACVNPKYEIIIGVCGSQMGKTDNLLNVIGHRLDDDPVPMLYVGPTQSNVTKVIEPRIIKMMRGCDSLWQKLSHGKGSSKTQKNVAGVSLRLAWAGSATELASAPAAIAMVDELDRMEDDVKGEGSPFEQVEARVSTYPDGKVIATSTPTLGNVSTIEFKGLTRWAVAEPEDVPSPIWQRWQEGSRHEWAWPCPECSEYFVPRFSLLHWPEGATAQRALKEAKLMCPHCASLIDESKKTWMNSRGKAVAPTQWVTKDGVVHGEEPDTTVYSLWVSGLCSPWRSFGQRARAFVDAVSSGAPGRVQAVINTQFGELYTLRGEAPDWEAVLELREPYSFGQVPKDTLALTCAVDVQKRSLYYEIRAWGYGMESWQIAHDQIHGETEHDYVWHELAKILQRDYDGHFIKLCVIDTGYRPGDKFRRPDNQIYDFCRRFKGAVRAVKGHETQEKPIKMSRIDISVGGKVIKEGLELWHLDSDYFKSWVHARLEWPKGEVGAWHLSKDTQEDYAMQVTAEARVTKPSGRFKWVPIRKDNHYLDTSYMNVSAAYMLQLHMARPSQVVTATREQAKKEEEADAPKVVRRGEEPAKVVKRTVPTQDTAPRRQRVKSKYMRR